MAISLQDSVQRAVASIEAAEQAIRSHPVAARWLLAGPGALAAALATMMAMPVWMPAGSAGVDNIVWPIVLAPLLWAVPFVYACLEEDLVRGARIMLVAIVAQSALVAWAMAS